ncbi:MAG: hypothetical protein ABTQ32_09180, partial [Myxococcaceae bacterium]
MKHALVFSLFVVTSVGCQCGGVPPDAPDAGSAGGGAASAGGTASSAGGAATGGGTSSFAGGATGGGTPFTANDAGVLVCKSLGAACGAASECCSLSCVGGLCGGPMSGGSCDPVAAPCTSAGACCSARCEPVPNSTQRSCQQACFGDGVACTRALECCSLACNSGRCGGALCKVSGENCTDNVDCCGHRCDNGRCSVNVTNCRPTGETCTSGGGTTCCGVCDKDVRPSPRCVFGADTCRGTGAACAPDGGAGNCCRGQCTGMGANTFTCTTPCAAPGATCNATTPCCAGTCTNGTCSQVVTIDAGVIDLGDGGVCRTLGQRCTGGGRVLLAVVLRRLLRAPHSVAVDERQVPDSHALTNSLR